MLSRRLARLTLVGGALLLLALTAFAACGDNKEGGGGGGGAPELDDGVLTIGSDIAYAPIEFYKEGTEEADGLDVDLAKALAKELGVEVEFINSGFDGIIEALNTDEFDVVMSAMTITDERSQQIDFVPYLNVGVGIVVPAGNPNNIQELEDFCGRTVAVQAGTIQLDELKDLNQGACADNNVDIVTFDTNPLAVEDVRTGGADANFSDFPVAFLDAQESDGVLEVVEPAPNPQPYGVGIRKDSTELKVALEEALQAVKDSGDYGDILTKWNLESTALD